MSLNETPQANRLHIGVFGKVNSGKSTFVNAFTGQQMSIVSEIAGTTTDLVTKAMEIPGIGACVIMDTAGFDDVTELGEARKERTRMAAEKCDIAIFVISEGYQKDISEEVKWHQYFKQNKIPTIFVINMRDGMNDNGLFEQIQKETSVVPILVNACKGEGIEAVKEALIRNIPEDFEQQYITGDLVRESDVVMLVMPQDKEAPKGRLILPQVQTIRELLDKQCIIISVTPEQMEGALKTLKNPPKLIITDSQVFSKVYEQKPAESMLTSFSILFAAYKGDLPYYIEGAKAIENLGPTSKVLIAECCTHAPLSEDIGRVKIPAMLRKRYGETLTVDVVSGTDFPADLTSYDLIIQCGGCMFNRKYVMSRIDRAKGQKVPMTNYGVTIAHLTGILDKITL